MDVGDVDHRVALHGRSETGIQKLIHLIEGEECATGRQQSCRCDVVLNQTTQRVTRSGPEELSVRIGNEQSFSSCHRILRTVEIDFVSIEIGIERVTVRIMHANSFLCVQNSNEHRHNTGLVESGLTVDQQRVSVADVTHHHSTPAVTSLHVQRLGESFSLGRRAAHQRDNLAVRVLHSGCSGIHIRAVQNELAEVVNVVCKNWFRNRQLHCGESGESNLVGLEVDVGRDN